MSIQFGRWNFDDQQPDPEYIDQVNTMVAPYGPDATGSYLKNGVSILYHAFHTTKESHREAQPHICPSEAVLTWDGRLDNRNELIREAHNWLSSTSTDVEIVAATYERCGQGFLAKLIGDWALSIWNPQNRSLLLARDFVGTRHLYYSVDENHVVWSTILDPLVFVEGKPVSICEEYMGGWLSYRPATNLTPFEHVRAVPPSTFVLFRIQNGCANERSVVYWNFDASKTIRYRNDKNYEEHFRATLSTAVQRRLRSDRPVLAELSGGLDSSTIVCMADLILGRGHAECPRLDTISWYDDSYDEVEPEWNEYPYFTEVEKKRGRIGCHINLAASGSAHSTSQATFHSRLNCLMSTPSISTCAGPLFEQYATYMLSQGQRVTLSGIGGDEVTGGGVPTPKPELQDLIARAQAFTLVRQLKAWSAKMERPRLSLLWEAIMEFLSVGSTGIPGSRSPAPWLKPEFVKRNYASLCAYPSRLKILGSLPSFQHNTMTLAVLRRTLAGYSVRPQLLREVRYPYLDRNLLEFLYAIPRNQIVGVGVRRYLMKRALVGFLPDKVLNRRRRALFQDQGNDLPAKSLPELELEGYMVSACMGIIDTNLFLQALYRARRHAEAVPIDSLLKTLTLESWLRHLLSAGILGHPASARENRPFSPGASESHMVSTSQESSAS